jgi:excisionase family DNA binding protein
MGEIYTVTEVAEKLKVRKGYVYELIYTGRLQAVRLSERRFRVTEQSLNDFIEQEQIKQEADQVVLK